jgi:hypothetical protein
VTSLIYNTKYSAVNPNEEAPMVNYFVVPWGGVRRSTLQDVILTTSGGPGIGEDVWNVLKPLPAFRDAASNRISQTAGYTIFTQSLKKTSMPDFPMPALDVDEDEDVDDEHDAGDNLLGPKSKDCPRSSPSNSTARGKTCKTPKMKLKRKPVQIVAGNNNPVSKTTRETGYGVPILRMAILPTVSISDGHYSNPLYFQNPRTKLGFVVDAVIRWSGNGQCMLFASKSDPGQINQMVRKGDELHVFYVNDGKREEDNLALSVVHGRDQRDRKRFKKESFAR